MHYLVIYSGTNPLQIALANSQQVVPPSLKHFSAATRNVQVTAMHIKYVTVRKLCLFNASTIIDALETTRVQQDLSHSHEA